MFITDRLPDDLFDASVVEMSHKIASLSKKKKSRPICNDSIEEPSGNMEEQKIDDTYPTFVDNSQQQSSSRPKTPVPHSPSQSPSPSPEHKDSPPPPEHTEQETTSLPERVATPFETLLLTTLQSKDLGNTGYVTGKEIASCLTHLPNGKSVRGA